MRALAARDLLRVWEWGEGEHPVDIALILLAVAFPEKTRDELVALNIGERDRLLFALRERTFGPRLDGYAECSQCSERLTFTVNVADLLAPDPGEAKGPELILAAEGFEVLFRLPNSLDFAAAALCDDAGAAHALLVRSCVLQARQDDTEIPVEALPEAVITALGVEAMKRAPLSEVQLALCCPSCGHRWQQVLDIVPFFWAEIAAKAKRLLLEVHTLAGAYGWQEADILAMSDRRRQLYVEMVT